jgi:DNA-binding NarL/FixJ family response regulator
VPTPIRVLLVDLGTLFRNCLAGQLRRRRNLEIVAQAGTGSEALAQMRSLQPDLVVIDPDVPEGGPELVAHLCRESPNCAVLALTADAQSDNASRVLQAGARGYVLKNTENYEIDDFVRAIERVHAGELVLAPAVADRLLKDSTGDVSRRPGPDGLTPRELEVLHLVAQGRTNPEIAAALYITEYTVKGHLGKLLHKLCLDNRVQLATYAVEHELVPAS